jgi:hypothetical protein
LPGPPSLVDSLPICPSRSAPLLAEVPERVLKLGVRGRALLRVGARIVDGRNAALGERLTPDLGGEVLRLAHRLLSLRREPGDEGVDLGELLAIVPQGFGALRDHVPGGRAP